MALHLQHRQKLVTLFSPVENVDWIQDVHYRVDGHGRVHIVEFPGGVETEIDPKTGLLRTTHEITISWSAA